jgi:hypothetical protein
MFPAIWAQTPNKLDAAQMMETDIALQEADKQACLNCVEVLRVKFSKAAKLKAATKEKGVRWSTLEYEGGPTDAGQLSINSAVVSAKKLIPAKAA